MITQRKKITGANAADHMGDQMKLLVARANRTLDRMTRSAQERSVLVILSILLGLGCWWLLTSFDPLLSVPTDQASLVVRFIFRALMYSCIAVCALTCFWACFRPRWLKRLLEHAAAHIRIAFCCVAGFLFIFARWRPS